MGFLWITGNKGREELSGRNLSSKQDSLREKVAESIKQGPPEEQAICVGCGFCCDGTLFLHAHLEPGERGSGELPEWIERNSITEDGKDYFPEPCGYFSEKCTIYDCKRADVCSSFRCQLLKDFASGKVTLNDALEVVRGAMQIRTLLLAEYRRISGKDRDTAFRQLLVELGDIEKFTSAAVAGSLDYDMFVARCNIFEALLTKHIRSAEDFEKMIMK